MEKGIIRHFFFLVGRIGEYKYFINYGFKVKILVNLT